MKMRKRRKLSVRLRLTSAVGTVLAGIIPTTSTHAALFFDNASASQAGVTGSYGTATGSTPNYFMGDAYGLATNPADGPIVDITGFDYFPDNLSGSNFSSYKIITYLWGTINTGTVNASSPAFSNQIGGGLVLTRTSAFNTGFYTNLQNSSPGLSPYITATTPIALNGTSSIGLAITLQGNLSGGTSYQPYNGANNRITYGVPPTVGTLPLTNGYYRNANNESNGNFTSTLRTVASTGTTATSEALEIRIYGDYLYDNWNSSSGGAWNSASASTYQPIWTNSDSPTSATNAVFNLSSQSGYTVTAASSVLAKSIWVPNDNVTLNMTTLFSSVNVSGGTISVGQPIDSSPTASGILNLTNSAQINVNGSGNVSAGSVAVGGNGGTGTLVVGNYVNLISTGIVTVGAGSALNLSAGTAVTSPNGALIAPSITLAGSPNAWTGKVDIGTGSLDLTAASLSTVTNQVGVGYNHGTWNNSGGITSTGAVSDTSHLTAIGVISNNISGGSLYGSGAPLGLFEGNNVGLNDVLVKYTYYGDTNLDGQVDGTDYGHIDSSFLAEHSPGNTAISGWYNGDFNYDGVVNGLDYTLIDNTFNQQGAQISAEFATVTTQLAPAGSSAVPEPATLGIVGMAVVGILGRRKRGAEISS